MKKVHVGIIIIMIALISLVFISQSNVDIVENIFGQSNGIEITFFILLTMVVIFLFVPRLKKFIFQNKNALFLKNLNVTEEFKVIYGNLKDKFEDNLTKLRKKIWLFSIATIVTFIVFICLKLLLNRYLFKYSENNTLNLVMLIVFGICMIFFIVNIIRYYKQYHIMYKNGVIKNLIKQMNNNLEYKEKDTEVEKLVKNQYRLSDFENEKIDTFYAEDFIIGKINQDISILISEIYTKKEENKEKNEMMRILFQGLFSTTTINKNTNATIKILTDEFKLINEDDFVKLDDSELEKNFDVYSTDKMLVMRILTPEIMGMLNKFYEEYKIGFEIIIKNNIVYLRFYTRDMFETSLIENPLNQKKLFLYYTTLKLVLDLIEKFNSNLNQIDM